MVRLAACVGLALLGACAARGRDDASALALPDNTATAVSQELRIGPNDVLRVSVFGESELDGEYQVDPSGRLKMPLIEPLMAKGYTTFELAETIEGMLGERYLQDPDVYVVIAESQGPQLTVDGAVKSPGLYPVRGQLTLLQAVALSGGPADGANPRKVVVFRQIEGERAAAAFDLVAIRNGDAEDPTVYGNDIIVVDGAAARRVYGEVLRSIPLAALFFAL
jgi:polysaccharide export outer membrane protein